MFHISISTAKLFLISTRSSTLSLSLSPLFLCPLPLSISPSLSKFLIRHHVFLSPTFIFPPSPFPNDFSFSTLPCYLTQIGKGYKLWDLEAQVFRYSIWGGHHFFTPLKLVFPILTQVRDTDYGISKHNWYKLSFSFCSHFQPCNSVWKGDPPLLLALFFPQHRLKYVSTNYGTWRHN